MPIPRIYVPVPLQVDHEVTLDARAVGHVVRVLRLRTDDTLILFNGSGNQYLARLSDVRKDAARCHVLALEERDVESPMEITLAQGISRGERMDFTIQKAVELGVSHIVPLATERSQVKLSGDREEKRLLHWQGVIIHACEQCGRTRLPELAPVQRLDTFLSPRQRKGHALVLDPTGDHTLEQLGRPVAAATLLIGPEGGLSPAERELAVASGFKRIRLGPRVLRTETAAIAALAALQAIWGDLH